jgi:integrase
MKLTTATVAKLALPADRPEQIFWDEDIPGFGLRLRAGGRGRWIFQYRTGRRQRRATIGVASAISPADARAMATKLYARTRLGEDPAAEKAKAVADQADTFERMADLYLERRRGELRPRSFLEVRRHLLIHSKPLHPLPLAEIDRRRIAQLLAGLGEKNGPVAANLVRASLSAFFSFMMREGIASANPITDTNKFDVAASRERVLSDEELKAIWVAADTAGQYGAIVKLLALTACRREEIGRLTWPEIDLDAALISLPGTRTKNHKPFQIPLSPSAVSLLATQPPRVGFGFLFGRMGFKSWAQGKAAIDRRAKIASWRVHDLRRTVSTIMHERLGVPPHVVEACLNHVSGHHGGVAGVYNKSQYLSEKRRALDMWAEHLLAVVEGRASKVVQFGRAAQ